MASDPARAMLKGVQSKRKTKEVTHSPRWPWVSAVIVGIAGLAISLGLRQMRARAIAQAAEKDFRTQAEELQNAVDQEVHLFMDVLASVRQLHSISDQISKKDFDEFVEKGLLFQKRTLGGFGLAQRTDDNARRVLEREKLGPPIVELGEDNKYIPATKHREYFPLTYQTPEDVLHVPPGFDFQSSEPCRRAIMYMMQYGTFALGGEEPGTKEQGRAGYFMFAPILYPSFRGMPIPPPGYLVGFAIGIFRPNVIVDRISKRTGAQQLIISLNRNRPRRNNPAGTASALTYEGTVSVANEKWIFRCAAAPEYLAAHRTSQPELILVTGLVITALLTLELLLMAQRARKTERIVQQRTAALREAKQRLEQEISERMRLESEILDISTREKLRVGQNLHDSLGQKLTGAVFLSRALSKRLPAKEDEARADAEQVTDLLKDALGQVRRIARGLAPVELSDEGIINALQRLAEETQETFGVHCSVEERGELLLSNAKTAIHLYHIAQEAVNNAIRHGEATRITITMAEDTNGGYMTISDNGKGFPPDADKSAGMGLKIMSYRAAMIGGTIETEKTPDGGMMIVCRFPVGKG